MKRFILSALMSLLLMLLSLPLAGCGAPAGAGSAAEISDSAVAADAAPDAQERPAAREYTIAGDGRITGEAAASLSPGQRQVILDFMHRYYQSVGSLSPYPCEEFFTSASQAELHCAVWQAVCEIRCASPADLSLLDYDFTLECEEVERTSAGYTEISMTENSVMHFAATPGVASELLDMHHGFTLSGSERTGWRIVRHMPWDSAYYPFMFGGRVWTGSGLDSSPLRSTAQILSDQREADAANIAARQAQRGIPDSSEKSPQHQYDRAAAVAYALEWAGARNPSWAAYDRNGGNCMNYVSQALHAGGIPMDGYGAAWYWYGDGNRTASWSGVNYFLTYAQTNSGYGMVCTAASPYYCGKPGDVILMGTSAYRHVVMITDIIAGDNGEALDYLICSNTGNYRSFPAGAYFYTNQELIRIYGWNS